MRVGGVIRPAAVARESRNHIFGVRTDGTELHFVRIARAAHTERLEVQVAGGFLLGWRESFQVSLRSMMVFLEAVLVFVAIAVRRSVAVAMLRPAFAVCSTSPIAFTITDVAIAYERDIAVSFGPIANITVEFVHFVLDDVVAPPVVAVVQGVALDFAHGGQSAVCVAVDQLHHLELAQVGTLPLGGA